MGCRRKDRLDSSAQRIVYEGRVDHSPRACLEAGFAEGSGLRNAHADVLHESRRKGPEPVAARDARARKIVAFEANTWREFFETHPRECFTRQEFTTQEKETLIFSTASRRCSCLPALYGTGAVGAAGVAPALASTKICTAGETAMSRSA